MTLKMTRSWMNAHEDLERSEVKKRFMPIYKSNVGKDTRCNLDRSHMLFIGKEAVTSLKVKIHQKFTSMERNGESRERGNQ